VARGKDDGERLAADKWAVTGGRVRASRGEEGRRREAEEGDERGRTTTKPMGAQSYHHSKKPSTWQLKAPATRHSSEDGRLI